jgi:hypothetical protein
MPRHTPAPLVGPAVLGLVLMTLFAAPTAAQPAPSTRTASDAAERYDDPVGNGIAIGAALGAIGGVVMTGALYANCRSLCDAPDELPTYAMYAGLGAGIGAGTGWLIDKLHKGRRPATIPVAVDIRADPRARAVRLRWQF